jgi:Concanavalin A-like lectin/glucanases superfamily/PEP-CTERM motif
MTTHSVRNGTNFAIALLAASVGGICHAQFALFDEITDTIGFSGDTLLGTAATYEAVVSLSEAQRGYLFFEQVNALEHKDFTIAATAVGGAGWTYTVNETQLQASTAVSLNVFHHIAFVRDGADERLYLDGALLVARTVLGTIDNSPQASHPGAIGASAYDVTDVPIPAFRGLLDSIRISNIARYSGPTITAATGDMLSDAGTLLLFNFNPEEVAGLTVTDVSGNGHDGILGNGGGGYLLYTAPAIVPEPGSASMLLLGGGLLARRSRSRGRAC